jgi:hypothetical protein
MRRRTLLILLIAAMICFVVVGLQYVGVIPPVGVSWGDGNRPGKTGYSVGLLDGSLILETLDGKKPFAPGSGGSTIKFDGPTVGFGGFYYRRFDLRLESPDGKRLPGTYGRQRRFWIAPGWTMLASLATAVLCRRSWVNARTHERASARRVNGVVSAGTTCGRRPSDAPNAVRRLSRRCERREAPKTEKFICRRGVSRRTRYGATRARAALTSCEVAC